MFLKAVFAGLCIGFGALASCGLPKPINGVIFSSGLILIILLQFRLFTGDILKAEKGFSLTLLKNWLLVYVGNFIGCFIFAKAIELSNYALTDIISIAQNKCSLSFIDCLIRGIFCNILVCIAVYMANKVDAVITKIFCIMIPITIFIICGFEHSIADMFYFTINEYSYINLIPVTIGNIIGGLIVIQMTKLTQS